MSKQGSKQESSKQGSSKQGGSSQGSSKQGGSSQGSSKQGGSSQGGSKQGGSSKGGNDKGPSKAVNASKAWQNLGSGDIRQQGGVRTIDQPNYEGLIEGLITAGQQDWLSTYAQNREITAMGLAKADNETRLGLGQFNLQGALAQAEATKFAASQQAEATKFAATEQARGSIETQRVASQSEERQIGLTGGETRTTNEQLEMFRRYKEQQDYSQARAAFRA